VADPKGSEAEPLVRPIKDLGIPAVLIGSATAIVSFFLPWYGFSVAACGKTVSASASAYSAGGGRFIILGTVAIVVVTAVLGRGLRWVTLLLAITLPVQVLAAMGNSTFSLQGPACANATGIAAFAGFPGISNYESGAYLGLASAVVILAGSIMHFAAAGYRRELRRGADDLPRRGVRRNGVGQTGRSVLVVAMALLGGLCGLALGLLMFGQSWANSAFFSSPSCGTARVTQESAKATPGGSTFLFSGETLSTCQTRPSPGWILVAGSVGLITGGYGTTLLLRRRQDSDGSDQDVPTPSPVG
jgi:hypothetical protein